MDAVREAIVAAIGLIIGTLAISLWTRFTASGKEYVDEWKKIRGLRIVATIALLGFFLSISSIVGITWRLLLAPDNVVLDIVNGNWSRGTVDRNHNALYSANVGTSDCPADYKLFSGYCSPDDVNTPTNRGRLEQVGFGDDGHFYCSWSGMPHLDTFQGSVRAVCIRLQRR